MGDHKHEDLHGHHQEEEEVEEALSLCDLPLNTSERNSKDSDDNQLSSEELIPDFFEFFSDLSTEMCVAEDIIFCGRIVPLNDQFVYKNKNKCDAFCRRRSGSLSELESQKTSRSSSAKTSHSLDYGKLRRSSSFESEVKRSPSGKSFAKGARTTTKSPKPRWYLLLFGLVKFPPEMELKDIKSRQVRSNLPAIFPPVSTGGKLPASQSGKLPASQSDRKTGGKLPVSQSDRKGSWEGLLKALSCKSHDSVAVTPTTTTKTAAFNRMPRG